MITSAQASTSAISTDYQQPLLPTFANRLRPLGRAIETEFSRRQLITRSIDDHRRFRIRHVVNSMGGEEKEEE